MSDLSWLCPRVRDYLGDFVLESVAILMASTIGHVNTACVCSPSTRRDLSKVLSAPITPHLSLPLC